jgi:guanylate kinase
VRASLPECVSIFILPPSRGALEQRLRDRKTESDAAIARRLRDAVGDMSHWQEFDYVVVNDDFERALKDLTRIVDSQGGPLRADRPALAPLLAELLA